MGCYTVPTIVGLMHLGLRHRISGWRENPAHRRLSWLLFGAAIFGIVDHAWNSELLRFSVGDVLLGATITAMLFLVWGVMTLIEARSAVSNDA